MTSSKRALHIDDDPLTAKLVQRVLEGAGYWVASARDGAAALRMLLEAPPSVVLLDIDIGEESGYELCNLMREAGTVAPVAFLSANRTLEHVRKALEVGGDYFIVKPFTPASLLAGIQKATAARYKIS